MRFVLIIPDGCADEPQESLGGRTPLESARTPAMDQIARSGAVGRASHVPAQFVPGSDVATMSLLGYDPNRYFSGRAPLEAVAQGIELGPDDWAIRCNLVSIDQQRMLDFTAGHIGTAQARQLLATLNENLDDSALRYHAGVSYRNLLLYRASAQPAPFTTETLCVPPHDLTDQPVVDAYPRGPGSDLLGRLMEQSFQLFQDHPVNRQRQSAGQLPATNVWLWGLGQAPHLPGYSELFGISGTMITAVDLLRGLARLAGWRTIEVPGATGYLDTNYSGKGEAAIGALADDHLVCVHVEATDEASHQGDVQAKIQALEAIDQHIVGPLLDHLLQQHQPFRILVMPDHPTPLRTKTHSHGVVPFAMCGDGIVPDEFQTYDEASAARSSLAFPEGWKLMPFFLSDRNG